MNWAYNPIKADAADVLLAEDWNRGWGYYAGLFNGNLDRDNFGQGVFDTEHVKKYAFNKVRSDGSDALTPYAAEQGTTAWQHGPDGSGYEMPSVTAEATVDSMVVVKFGCSWEWDVSGGPTATQNDELCVRFRITVNGATVAQSGWSPMHRTFDSVPLVGALPVEAGAYVVQAQLQIAAVHWDSDASDEQITSDWSNDFPLSVKARELIVTEKRR